MSTIKSGVRLLDLAEACAEVFIKADVETEIEQVTTAAERRNLTDFGVAVEILKLSMKTHRHLLGVLDEESSSKKFWEEEVKRVISTNALQNYFATIQNEVREKYPDCPMNYGIRNCVQAMVDQILSMTLNTGGKSKLVKGLGVIKKGSLGGKTVLREDIVAAKEQGVVRKGVKGSPGFLTELESVKYVPTSRLDVFTSSDLANRFRGGK